MKKLFGIVMLLLLFLSPATVLARGGHGGHGHGGHSSHGHSSHSSKSSGSSKSSSSSKSSWFKKPSWFGKSSSKSSGYHYVPSTPVHTWKNIPQTTTTTSVNDGFLYPTTTQRLLFTPRPVVHPTVTSDDSQEKEDRSKFIMGVLVIIFSGLGLIGFITYLQNQS